MGPEPLYKVIIDISCLVKRQGPMAKINSPSKTESENYAKSKMKVNVTETLKLQKQLIDFMYLVPTLVL